MTLLLPGGRSFIQVTGIPGQECVKIFRLPQQDVSLKLNGLQEHSPAGNGPVSHYHPAPAPAEQGHPPTIAILK